MENRTGTVEAGWAWTGGSSTSKDTWSEICGDGVDAAVKDGAAIVKGFNFAINMKYFTIFIIIK